MAKQRKSRTSKASFSNRFTAEFYPWRNGDTNKADPFFILILNNIALEKRRGPNRFAADMSMTADKDLFVDAARYINKNLFGEMNGQKEMLLADSPHSKKIKLWSVFLSQLPLDDITSLVREHKIRGSFAIQPRRDAVVSMLARLGMNPDIVFLVSNSPSPYTRAWAIPTTDDDARPGIAGTYDGKAFYHRFYHKIPGMVAMNVRTRTMTAAHEFGHAFSSFTNGHIGDLYHDHHDCIYFNKKMGRPIPHDFAEYQGIVYPSDKKRDSLGYGNWVTYHSELEDPAHPALMDDYSGITQPMLCLHDKITKAYIMDRIAAKVSR